MTLQLKLQMVGNTMSFVVPAEAAAELIQYTGELATVTIEPSAEELAEDMQIAEDAMLRYDQTFRDLAK